MEECLGRFVEALICQWPEKNVRVPVGTGFNTYLSVNEATEDARIWFHSWYRNAKFKESIGQTQEILDDLDAGDQQLLGYSFSQPRCHYRPKRNHVDFNDIIGRSAPSLSPARLENFDSWVVQQDEDGRDRSDLKSLLGRLLSESSGRYEQLYAIDLVKSFDSVDNSAEGRLSGSPNALKPLLEEHLTRCKTHVDDVYQMIRHRLQVETSTARRLACGAKMWPRLSTTSLQQHLARGKVASLRDDWKSSLIEYRMAISNLQRAERLITCLGKDSELLSELGNPGHQG